MSKPLDTETRLLLLCASTRHTEEQKGVIETLTQNAIDWDHLIKLADHHRLMPLLYRTLSSVCPDSVPKDIFQKLKQFYKNNATRNFLMTGAILQIDSICAANNIETLPVKGPLLAATVYGDISLRSFSDIDILVPDKDIQNIIALLLENKYKLVPNDIPEDIFLRFLKINHDGRLRTDKGFLFELHRDLADWYTPKEMTFESIKPYTKQTNLLGHTVNDICPEMLLAYLALHGNKHGWLHLEQLCCIAELLKKEQTLNWELLFEIAGEYKILRRLLLSLRLVELLFEVKLPQTICQKTTDNALSSLAERILQEITDPQVLDKNPERFRDKATYHWKLMDRSRDLISFLAKGLAVPGTDDWQCLAIPLPLFPLYYLYKPFRIIFTPHSKAG